MSSSSSSSESEASSSASSSRTSHAQLKRKFDPESDSESSSASEEFERENEKGEEGGNEEDEGEQVLSHAAARKLKKKQKLLEKIASSKPDAASSSAGVGVANGKQSGKSAKAKGKEREDKKPSEKPKRQNSVWVGNLSFKTTPDGLKKFFVDAGEVTRVHMPMKTDPKAPKMKGVVQSTNRGFAYVDFATPEAKVAAIALSEKNLDGRRLLIKDGDDFTGRPVTEKAEDIAAKVGQGHSKTAQKILAAQKQPAGPCLFLGNLGFETTEDSIKEMLNGHAKQKGKEKEKATAKPADEENAENDAVDKTQWHGVGSGDAGIRKVRMGTFEDSGLCKGFAFVDFISTEHATAALINPRNHFLDGRKLVVEYASPDAVRRGGGPGAKEKRLGREKGANGKSADERPAKRARNDDNDTTGMQVDDQENRATEKRQSRKVEERHGRRRPKPGAALAQAQREKVAIVPSAGTKMKFE